MKTVNTHEAKTQLSRILSEVEKGEEYVVARAGRPIARLVPYRESTATAGPGKWRGRVVIHEDFDDEDEKITALFEGTDQ
jgi:prevent-host-death family protein